MIMVDKSETDGKMYYCPYRNEILTFNASIIRSNEIPKDITTLDEYVKRTTAIGGGFIDV